MNYKKIHMCLIFPLFDITDIKILGFKRTMYFYIYIYKRKALLYTCVYPFKLSVKMKDQDLVVKNRDLMYNLVLLFIIMKYDLIKHLKSSRTRGRYGTLV